MLLFLLFLFLPKPCFAEETPTPAINPTSGIYLSEYMPKGSEWVEIFNDNDCLVILNDWKIDDDPTGGKNPLSIPYISIDAKSFYIVELGEGFLNDSKQTGKEYADYVVLINDQNNTVESTWYDIASETYSWSKQPDNTWCQVLPTKNDTNNTCNNQPISSTPVTTTNTPTPDPSPPILTSTPIPTPVSEFIIADAPDDIEISKTFSVSFEIKNAFPNLVFHIKGFDIDNPAYTQTQNGDNWLNYNGTNSAWDSHPSFSTDNNGYFKNSINLRFRSDKDISPDYPSRLRLKSDTLGESGNIQVIVVKVPLIPTNTPTSTSAPNPTATLTKSPTSTPKPTVTISLTPTPSKLTPSPTQIDTPTPIPTEEPIPQVLGTTSPSNPKQPKDPRRILPIVFMVTGGLFLTTPALITKFKKIKKK